MLRKARQSDSFTSSVRSVNTRRVSLRPMQDPQRRRIAGGLPWEIAQRSDRLWERSADTFADQERFRIYMWSVSTSSTKRSRGAGNIITRRQKPFPLSPISSGITNQTTSGLTNTIRIAGSTTSSGIQNTVGLAVAAPTSGGVAGITFGGQSGQKGNGKGKDGQWIWIQNGKAACHKICLKKTIRTRRW